MDQDTRVVVEEMELLSTTDGGVDAATGVAVTYFLRTTDQDGSVSTTESDTVTITDPDVVRYLAATINRAVGEKEDLW